MINYSTSALRWSRWDVTRFVVYRSLSAGRTPGRVERRIYRAVKCGSFAFKISAWERHEIRFHAFTKLGFCATYFLPQFITAFFTLHVFNLVSELDWI